MYIYICVYSKPFVFAKNRSVKNAWKSEKKTPNKLKLHDAPLKIQKSSNSQDIMAAK